MTDFLNAIELFKDVPANEVEHLMTCSRDHDYKGRHLLYLPGDPLEHVFLVHSGEVTLYYLHDGKRIIVDVMGEGDVFGNFSSELTTTVHFAEAAPETRLCQIKSTDFLGLIQRYPLTLVRTITLLSKRLLEYEHKLSLCPAPAKEKILYEIERYAKREATSSAHLTHQKLAQMTGLNRVTVTRGIQDLVSEGKIEVTEGGMRLLG